MSLPERETTLQRYTRLFAAGPSLGRTVAFSDGVFGIAITLLVLDVRVPDATPNGLGPALLELLPNYFTFVLSFVVIGQVWLSHHRKFDLIVAHTPLLLRLNLLMLLFVVTLPFPTALLGRYGDQPLAAIVYALCLACVGLSLGLLWAYAWRKGLVSAEVTPTIARFMLVQTLVFPAVFLLSVPVALVWGATAAELSWIAVLPIARIVTAVLGRRAADSEPVPDTLGE